PRSPLCTPFCFNGPAPSEIYPLSLHDALPILTNATFVSVDLVDENGNKLTIQHDKPMITITIDVNTTNFMNASCKYFNETSQQLDRKSTRLNSSHVKISYAVFCLKKKKNTKNTHSRKLHALGQRNDTWTPIDRAADTKDHLIMHASPLALPENVVQIGRRHLCTAD